jgi:hypothetical protein
MGRRNLVSVVKEFSVSSASRVVVVVTFCGALAACGSGHEPPSPSGDVVQPGATTTRPPVQRVAGSQVLRLGGHPSKARARARVACRDLKPRAVIGRYLPRVRADVPAALVQAAKHPSAAMTADARYATLAGAVYAATVPRSRRVDAAAGCSFELSRVLSKKLKGTS